MSEKPKTRSHESTIEIEAPMQAALASAAAA